MTEGDLVRFLIPRPEKRVLEWIAFHPLLAVEDLQVLLRAAQTQVESVLRNLESVNLVASVDAGLQGEDVPIRCYFLTSGGFRLIAERDGVPIVRFAKYSSVAAAMPVGQGGGRLQTLLRQIDHTVGSNRFFVRIVEHSARADALLVRWLSPSEAAQQFVSGGSQRWLRPDGAGDLNRKGQTRRFYLEWDRGTMRWPQMQEKCRLYAQYYASLHQASVRSIPHVLLVKTSPRREWAIWEALNEALKDASCPSARILMSVTNLIDRLGPFGSVWRNCSSELRRTPWP